jgi:predicted metal-dependent peptidase
MKVLAGQAAQAAKMCGQLGANMERILGSVMQPVVDWRAVLQDFMQTRSKDEVSFLKPNRRFLAHDIYLPSRTGERLGKIGVAVDCSGSINEKEIAEFAAEITDIKDRLTPSEMHVVYFHHEVSRHDIFSQDEDAEIKPNGTGGTAFSPIFRALEPYAGELDAVVVLTDLCCSDFGPEPEYPVLWVSNAYDQAPWGEIVMMKPGRV